MAAGPRTRRAPPRLEEQARSWGRLKALEERVSEGNLEAVDAYLKIMDRVDSPKEPLPIDGLMGRIGELENRVTFLEKLGKVRVVG